MHKLFNEQVKILIKITDPHFTYGQLFTLKEAATYLDSLYAEDFEKTKAEYYIFNPNNDIHFIGDKTIIGY